ncbi:MAG: hypothetical protein B1H13_00025 [Desulfobacteraceae bacterium 4484_190.3]|nr:MAG: hypothetical protein B1H13_00025 [Desulfobacteraceae bacterium 4484_190.3]
MILNGQKIINMWRVKMGKVFLRLFVTSVIFMPGILFAFPSVFPTGVTIYKPDKCWNGYTVLSNVMPGTHAELRAKRGVVLIDMNGNIVHAWKGVVGFPAKLLPGGRLMGALKDKNSPGHDNDIMVQLDFNGNIEWQFNKSQKLTYKTKDGKLKTVWSAKQHHDFQREPNPVGYYVPGMAPYVDKGKTLVQSRGVGRDRSQRLYEVSWDGKVLWEWNGSDYLDQVVSNFGSFGAKRKAKLKDRRAAASGSGGKPGADRSADNGKGKVFIEKFDQNKDGKVTKDEFLGPDQVFDRFDQNKDGLIDKGEASRGSRGGKPRAVGSGVKAAKRAGPKWNAGNTASWLGPNKWYDAGDKRFHPDNIICNNLSDTIFIISRKTGKIVWQVGPDYSKYPQLDKLGINRHKFPDAASGGFAGGMQHHSHMIPKGLPGEGNILVFNNGMPYSLVMEFNPVTLEIVWEYSGIEIGYSESHSLAHSFFSATVGSAQRLPNGNTLICEGDDGRIFEVTPEHEIVWEYISPMYDWPGLGWGQKVQPPKMTNMVYRAYRYPYSYVPQLEEPEERPVIPPENTMFTIEPEQEGPLPMKQY